MAIEVEMLESRQMMSGNSPFEPEMVARGGGLPLAIVDFNGDSRPDLLVQRARRLELHLNDGEGGFGAPADAIVLSIQLSNYFDAAGRVAVGRFTSGDELDVVVATGVGRNAQITLLKNDGLAGFTACAPASVVLHRGSAGTIAAGLFDGDGETERATVVISDGAALREIRLGDRGRVRTSQVIFERRGRIDSFAIGDADGDGRDDVAVACSKPGDGLWVRLGTLRALVSVDDGSGAHTFGSMLVGRMGSSVLGQLRLADATGDGLADIVAVAAATQAQHLQVVMFESMAVGPGAAFGEERSLFDFLREPPDNYSDRLTLIGVGDFNGDGRPDVAYDFISIYNGRMFPWSGGAVLLKGGEDGEFTAEGIPGESYGYEGESLPRGFAFVDAADDGVPDLLKLNSLGRLVMQRQYPPDWTQPPVIGSLSVSAITLPSGKRRITALGVSDPDGMVCGVRFRFDAGDDGEPYWTGTDLDGSDGWSVELRADSYYGPLGEVKRFWAVAWDEFGFASEEVMVEVTFA